MIKSVLVVDDDELMRSFVSTVLSAEGYHVEEAKDGKTGMDKLLNLEFDLVVTDLKMPDIDGMNLIGKGKKISPETKWIVVTAYGSIRSAVEAMKAGASDYLTKPLKSPDELRHVVNRVLRETEAELKISLLSEELGKTFPPPDMIFLGEKMSGVHRLVRNVAPTPASVLICGPSGTGKELIARVIHELSPRKGKPFIAVHCAALSETLLESELFGHEKGAFTGALSAVKGRFELADSGTIFLDEIGEVMPAVQVKLLRVLQERTLERVGGTRTISVDIRIISATNKDLRAEVAAGRFREDLFYRLNVFPVMLPSLVERKEAIIPLAGFFIRKFSDVLGKKGGALTPAAQSRLLEYGWPGNIRELQNIIERALILADGDIDEEHLSVETPGRHYPDEGLIRTHERDMIRKVLEETGGNRKKAAQMLGISLRTLQYRIKEYNLWEV
jgi:DNA-binding NtrC family response regulator